MAKRHPFKPAVDTICDLRSMSPGPAHPWTVAELRREARSQWWLKEEAQFIKWAKRHGLIVSAPGNRYFVTVKGDRVSAKACGNWGKHRFGRGPRGGARLSTRQR